MCSYLTWVWVIAIAALRERRSGDFHCLVRVSLAASKTWIKVGGVEGSLYPDLGVLIEGFREQGICRVSWSIWETTDQKLVHLGHPQNM